jgi:hypothetical protein
MAKRRPRPRRTTTESDQAELHEPTEAELDERVSLYPLTPEEVLRALVRPSSDRGTDR